jgi:hypothetical protein
MMTTVLWIGTALGAVAGFLHAIHLYRRWAARPGSGGRLVAIYRGLWAFGLWTLFGSYLLVLWLIGAAAYVLCRLSPKRSAA